MLVQKEPNRRQILEHLERVLSFHDFAVSRVLSSFLTFVVEETLEGRAANLKEYTIAVQDLGRAKNFDPKLDPIVRIHAGRLRRALKNYYHEAGARDLVHIEIPTGAYVPEFSLNASSSRSAAPDKNKDSLKAKPVIAVLPFRNLSDNPNQEFFAEGLSMQLSIELGRFHELDVIAFPTSRYLAKTTPDLPSVGMELKADYLVSGNVRRTNDKVRIQAQLYHLETGKQLWAEFYDRKLSSRQLLEIEDEVVHHLTSVIGGHYGVVIRDVAQSSRPPKESGIESHDAVLWYYYYQLEHTKESFQHACAALEQAVQADPDYAHAWGVLGELYLSAMVMGFPPGDDQLDKGIQCARKAIQIDPQDQAGYQALTFGHLLLKQQDAMLETAEACLAVNPHATIALGAMAFCFACAVT